ncbi:malto-oligosyltrehalose synthase [Streptomyces sp. 8N706]|uniref:malto-oligosyltrehalose synthase n=1 Tax=Streptomyces sp. 8N706 TaxID=3457416 RepID=UPI003FCF6C2C
MTPEPPQHEPSEPAPHRPVTTEPTAPPEPGGAPTATYRLQLQPGFPFSAATAAVPYLASLGVSHLHLSPVLEAVPGSAHGYDVVDHSAVRGELGGEEGLRELSRTARRHGLGLVLDIVPNHMAVPVPEQLNRPLWEVLRDGPDSPYARWFDIDWEQHGGRVLLPVLGGRLGDELEHIAPDGDVLRYHDHVFPVRPGTAHLPLPELLDVQWYRLGWWRLARTELNYRRFFTISELIGVRVQDPVVFDATHAKVLELLHDGVVDGLRVDHPDGLADPGAYLRRLDRATGGRWTVVEKILTGGERLPADWPVAGTTGYDALRRVDGLFVDPAGAADLLGVYRGFTGQPADRGGEWAATERRAGYKVVTHELAAEVSLLARTAARICETTPALRDHAPWALRTAVRELLVRVPVYRPYAVAGERVPEGDTKMLRTAAEGARAVFTVPEEADAVDLVRDLALGLLGATPDHREFCSRFAQTSSALRAKSVEDKAFYRYAPLLSAGEVGGDPGSPAVSVDGFHDFCARLQRDWPATGTVLSTHDTKRSADVRSRIALLTEAPGEWAGLVEQLTKETARPEVPYAPGSAPGRAPEGAPAPAPAPDRHVAWTAWQAAFGLGFPCCDRTPPERLVPAVVKSVREAGLRTSWTEGDPAYEAAVEDFVTAGPCGPPMRTAAPLIDSLAEGARANILGATLLHLTMPGVPDVYQGTEREYTALVDPDNRRPFGCEPGVLAELDAGRDPRGLSEDKLRLTATALRLRRAHPDWFGGSGHYEPLALRGAAAVHGVAFSRAGEAVTAVTRLPRRLEEAGGWRDTEVILPEGRWTDLLSGRTVGGGAVRAAELFDGSPVALLIRG